MRFEECHPFIRFARDLTLTAESVCLRSIPYDARLFYARRGAGEILVDGRTYPMNEGSVLYLPPATPYLFLAPEKSVTYFALNFDLTMDAMTQDVPVPPAFVDSIPEGDILCRVRINDAVELNGPFHLTGMQLLEPSLSSIGSEYLKQMIFFEARMSAVLFKVLTDCVRRSRVSGNNLRRYDGGDILDYIQQHFREDLSNESVAERFGFHKNYVSELVKTATGRPMHQYLLYIRLSRAWELLEGSEMSIADIAAACGFSDICYFSRYFKQVYGHAPSYFRKRLGGL